ncbi:RDD family protein [Chitinophaga vietnamensis]|uniref:RDD family protein n=1 Tax=Chitinophaga vietnamensis TaxID=2593957 RepID=UPI00117792C6|nr:RDD family protein [Chitinophaga vietnamensis]
MSNIKIPTSFNIDLEFESADLGQRFLAWLIDLAVRLAFVLLVVVVINGMVDNGSLKAILFVIFLGIPLLLYFLLAEIIMRGQTPGKMAMSLKVVSMMGNQPSISQHLVRWLFRIIEQPGFFWALIPIISIARSPYNQRVGDVVAGTIVISTKRKGSIEETIFRDLSHTDYQPHFPQIMKLSDRDMNKVKDLLDRALKAKDEDLAARVAFRVKEVLHIQSDMSHTQFLETVLNDYNYYTTKDN